MKILFHLLDAEVSGGQLVAESIAKEAVARDHEVGLIVPRTGPMLERFTALGSAIHELAVDTLKRPLAVFRASTVLWLYDVLYSHTSVPGQILGDCAARLAGRPHVIHEHSLPYFSRRWPAGNFQRRLFARSKPNRVIAVGSHIAENLEADGIDSSVIQVVPNGAPDLGTPAARPVQTSVTRVGMIGRLDRGKGIDEFIAAVEPLCTSTVIAHVAGRRGPYVGYESELKERLRRGPVSMVETLDAQVFLDRLDLVAIPSHYEGSPLVLFEAMALGKAIVASDIPGIREVIRDGHNGLLVPAGDVGALKRAISNLIHNRDERLRLGTAARIDARERFTMRKTVNRCLEILEEVVEGPRIGGRRSSS